MVAYMRDEFVEKWIKTKEMVNNPDATIDELRSTCNKLLNVLKEYEKTLNKPCSIR